MVTSLPYLEPSNISMYDGLRITRIFDKVNYLFSSIKAAHDKTKTELRVIPIE